MLNVFIRYYVVISFRTLQVGRVGSTTDLITHQLINVHDYLKDQNLIKLLHEHATAKRILVFVDRKSTAQDLDRLLEENGFYAASIHGDKSQPERETSLNNFARGATKILVATDVASQGLDIDGIDLVVNYGISFLLARYIPHSLFASFL